MAKHSWILFHFRDYGKPTAKYFKAHLNYKCRSSLNLHWCDTQFVLRMVTHAVGELTSVKPAEVSKRKVTVAIYSYILHTLFPIDLLLNIIVIEGHLAITIWPNIYAITFSWFWEDILQEYEVRRSPGCNVGQSISTSQWRLLLPSLGMRVTINNSDCYIRME
jgi:hypothetical protein